MRLTKILCFTTYVLVSGDTTLAASFKNCVVFFSVGKSRLLYAEGSLSMAIRTLKMKAIAKLFLALYPLGLINMFLFKYSSDLPVSASTWFDAQKPLQIIFVLVALACVPTMLIVKPYLLYKKNEARKSVSVAAWRKSERERKSERGRESESVRAIP